MAILSMTQLRQYRVPRGSLTLWWLGQAGFIVKSPGGKIVAIDPYLSNSCKAIGDQYGFDMDRLVPPPLPPADLVGIDAYAMTHSHQDHLDPETLRPYRAAGGVGPFVAPPETIEKLVSMGVPQSQTAMIWPNKSVTLGDLTLRGTFAIPFAGDDLTHVGYLVCIKDGPKFYVTGDTGYHEILADSMAAHKPDILAAVINPAFHNMSPAEAATLAHKMNAKVVIPCHYDLFPANSLPPELLRTNLRMLGIGDRYQLVEHGKPLTYPAPAA
ncbi:MAG: MBL fold metallo-hydrolase [Phycisphaerae bacterium]|nr:MBL fold metallo-hydrolase [Phycisphaerae bacterium]